MRRFGGVARRHARLSTQRPASWRTGSSSRVHAANAPTAVWADVGPNNGEHHVPARAAAVATLATLPPVSTGQPLVTHARSPVPHRQPTHTPALVIALYLVAAAARPLHPPSSGLHRTLPLAPRRCPQRRPNATGNADDGLRLGHEGRLMRYPARSCESPGRDCPPPPRWPAGHA
jgi:hypothetical protein